MECELLSLFVDLVYCIDMSMLCINVLCVYIKEFISDELYDIMLMFELFGFKYGVLIDVDFVFDVCLLFNLYYDM